VSDQPDTTIVIAARDIELNDGTVLLQDLHVGDHIEIRQPTAGLHPGIWVITAFESDNHTAARMRRLTREETRAAQHGDAFARLYE
jgi:hypothetical protein